MPLVRLVYASRWATSCNEGELSHILDMGQDNNRNNDVDSLLVHDSHSLAQWIEGERDAVNDLYRRIVQDARSLGHTIILYEETRERLFPGMALRMVRIMDLPLRLIQAHGLADGFLAQTMTTDSSRMLFLALSDMIGNDPA